MSEIGSNQSLLPSADPGPPRKRTPRTPRLNSADDVRVEMARIYREVRHNQMDVGTGKSLIYMLAMIGKMIEISIIEKDVDALENGR